MQINVKQQLGAVRGVRRRRVVLDDARGGDDGVEAPGEVRGGGADGGGDGALGGDVAAEGEDVEVGVLAGGGPWNVMVSGKRVLLLVLRRIDERTDDESGMKKTYSRFP
jgi:hypothetical protein